MSQDVGLNKFHCIYEIHCEGNSKLRLHNTCYCLIELLTEAGLTVL